MNVNKIRLRFFRNYEEAEAEFQPGLNILVGQNGQGKTNLLESVYFMSTAKSHRNVDDVQMIEYGKDFFTIDCTATDESGPFTCSAVVHKKGKTLCLRGTAVPRVSDYIGKINAVLFSPLDMTLFDASPSVRRHMVDMELGKLSKLYTTFFSRYVKLLKERNALLKNEVIDEALLESLDEQMIRPQIEIMRQRNLLVSQLNAKISDYYKQISRSSDLVKIRYLSFIPYDNDEEMMKRTIEEKQITFRERDKATGMTNFGVQREDIEFTLNGFPVRSYGSQGQKRMVIIALKLSLIGVIYDRTGDYPVLLLDDVLSELDDEKKNALIDLLPSDVQTIITTVSRKEIKEEMLKKARIIEIRKGSVYPCPTN